MDNDTLRSLGLSINDLQRTIQKERDEAQRRLVVYRGDRGPLELKGKIAILVDDGIATGSTARAALRMISKSDPAKVVLAVPVLPSDRVPAFKRLVDDLVYIEAPKDFHAVGQFYQKFDQTEDDEVIDLLRKNQHETTTGATTDTARSRSQSASQ